jgi:hypothetical protein
MTAHKRQESSPARWHFSGNIAATTALRILLTASGVRDPRNGNPLSEAMLFGIAGGIGMGLTSFYYEKGSFSSFYIAGRHAWSDDLAYLKAAAARFHIQPVVIEAGGTKAAATDLRDALAEGRPCIAWLDMAGLPHRAMPAIFSGGGYHIVTVYSVDEDRRTALIGDLTVAPIEIDARQLSAARARIKQFKNRLMTIPASKAVELSSVVRAGLEACYKGLRQSGGKGAAAMSGLEMLQKWETDLSSSDATRGWRKTFPRGGRLWQGLTSIHEYIENYHTGGGLCRPLFAEFLAEASRVQGWSHLAALSKRYSHLGAAWSDLALSAIPQEKPAFREVRKLSIERAELRSKGNAAAAGKIGGIWSRLSELQKAADKEFPLSESECADLQRSLQSKVASLREAEFAAHAALGEASGM